MVQPAGSPCYQPSHMLPLGGLRAPPGLESKELAANWDTCLSDVKTWQGAGSPMKIQLNSLSCLHFVQEPMVDHAPEAMQPVKAQSGRLAQEDATRLRPRLQNAAYAPNDARQKLSSQPPKAPQLQPAVPPGVFKIKRDLLGIPHDAPRCSQRRDMNRKADETPKPARTIRIPPSLHARLSTESEEVSVYEVLPCLGAVARDGTGSKFLQDHLPKASPESRAMLCGAVLPELIELSLNQFGHAFILQLMEVSTADQKKVILERLSSHVMQLSLDPYGCYVIQKALQIAPREGREQVFSGLREGTIECIRSRHGNHVIQLCIEMLPSTSVSFILEAVESWGAEEASAQICACRVVMRLLEHMPREQLDRLLQQIFKCVIRLAQDRFGNYVLQHIVENGHIDDKQVVMEKILKGDVLELAKNRYAHNLIMKCIQVSFCETLLSAERQALSNALLGKNDEESSAVLKLSSDRFGSEVVQCLKDHLQQSMIAGAAPTDVVAQSATP